MGTRRRRENKAIDKSIVNIVIIDDSDMSRLSIRDILSKEGFSVVADFKNPQEGIIFINSRKIDLVICDVVMPEMNGIEVTQELKSKSKGITVIMMSSLNEEHIIVDSISAGAVDFILKPFKKDHLLEIVNKHVDIIIKDK